MNDASDRLEYLDKLIAAMDGAWPRIASEIEHRIDAKLLTLIASENAEARGAIKALKDLLDLPATLKSERDHITAELSERDSAS